MMTRILSRKYLDQGGDTIVEVLISIAIASLILAISYATTNHNVRSIQDAQERSHAIQLAQRQIELLKAHHGITAGKDCYDLSGGEQNSGGGAGNDQCVTDATGRKAAAGLEPSYQIKITPGITPGITPVTQDEVSIIWNSLLNAGKDNLTMYYRP